MTTGMAGIDPVAATGLVAALTTAADDLGQRRRRVINTLDAIGQAADAPGLLAEVEAWLIASAADLRRRVGLIAVPATAMGPLAPGSVWAPADDAPAAVVVPDTTMGPLPPGHVWASSAAHLGAAALSGTLPPGTPDPESPWPQWSITGLPSDITNPDLFKILKALYRDWTPGSVGSGSNADAVRYEIETGLRVGGRLHYIKSETETYRLETLLGEDNLTEAERTYAEQALDAEIAARHSGVHPTEWDRQQTRQELEAQDAQAQADAEAQAAGGTQGDAGTSSAESAGSGIVSEIESDIEQAGEDLGPLL